MTIINKLLKSHNSNRERNTRCQCGSGLKFKHCHGDQEKMKVANVIANLAMSVMIHHRRHAAGLVDETECDEKVGQLQEVMYNMLDPDYEPPRPSNSMVVESEDRKRERQEDEVTNEEPVKEPEPEIGGQDKINSIRETSGIDRCPKCGGIKMVEEEMCYKCKKGK